jgi:hypothetical protein
MVSNYATNDKSYQVQTTGDSGARARRLQRDSRFTIQAASSSVTLLVPIVPTTAGKLLRSE